MSFPLSINSTLTLPIVSYPVIEEKDAAMNVKFVVPHMYECYDKRVLLTISILININNEVNRIYKSKVVRVAYDPIQFEVVLPLGSIILDAVPTYIILNGGT